MIKLSVLVPVYNVEKYLAQCIESILQQTLREIEIICIDDGSTDSSASILDNYAARDSRIKIIHKENTGYGDSMNHAIDMAQGEYIGIVESDDFIEKEMYEKLYIIAVEKELDFIKANYYEYENGEKKCISSYDLNIYNQVFCNNECMNKFNNTTMAIWTGLYKTSFLKSKNIKFLPTPGASYQDISFMFKVYVSAKKGYVLNEAYVNYRVDNEMSSVKSKGKVYCVCEEIAECKRFLDNREDKMVFAPHFIKVMFYVYSWNIERIDIKYLEEFVSYISNEWRMEKQGNYINKELFSTDEWLKYTLISDCAEKYIQFKIQEKIDSKTDNDKIYENGYRNIFENNDNVYIYGAGTYGRRIERLIKKINLKCNIEFVVSNKNCSSEEQYLEINEKSLNKNFPIIISVANLMDRARMTYNAKQEGFKEIICVDSILLKMANE